MASEASFFCHLSTSSLASARTFDDVPPNSLEFIIVDLWLVLCSCAIPEPLLMKVKNDQSNRNKLRSQLLGYSLGKKSIESLLSLQCPALQRSYKAILSRSAATGSLAFLVFLSSRDEKMCVPQEKGKNLLQFCFALFPKLLLLLSVYISLQPRLKFFGALYGINLYLQAEPACITLQVLLVTVWNKLKNIG
jgi:hypothetical protein